MLIMNGDNDLAFQTLSGIYSLTNVLPELPLPAPSQNSLSSQSLLYEPRLSEEAHSWLSSEEENLVSSLTMALASTNTDNIEFKEGSATEAVDHNALPPLIKAVVNRNDAAFKNKRGFAGIFTQPDFMNWVNLNESQVHFQGMNYGLSANYHLSDVMTPSPEQPISKPNDEVTDNALEALHYSFPEFQFLSDSVQIENKPPSSIMHVSNNKDALIIKIDKDPDAIKKSDKKKKRKKKKHRDSKHSNDEENTQYSIVKTYPDSQKLVLSLVKSPEDIKKLKKKKKKKDKYKEKERDREKKHKSTSKENEEPIKLNIKLSNNGDNAQIISSTIPLTNNKSLTPICNSGLNKSESQTFTPQDSNFSHNQITENLSPISSKQCPTSMSAGLGTPSTTMDRVSQCSTSSLVISSSQEPDHHMWNYPVYINKPDDQFDLSMPIDITGNKNEYLFSDLITGEDLLSPLTLNISNNSMLNSVLRESVNEQFLLDDFDNNSLDMRPPIKEPGGLASYLSSGSKDMEMANMEITTPKQTYGNMDNLRKLKYRKNIKKRKNELDGLKTWFVGSGPQKDANGEVIDLTVSQESNWDKTLGSYSQKMTEKARKRKRTIKQTSENSAFVFEHDEEYVEATNASNPAEDSDSYTDVSKRTLRNNSINYVGMEDGIDNPDEVPQSRAKKRKKDDDEPFEVKLKDPNEIKYPHLKKSQENNNHKRRERVNGLTKLSNNTKKLQLPLDMLDPNLITESTTYQHFISLVDACLEVVEDLDLIKTMKEQTESDIPISLPPDVLISREQLQAMCNEIAKLKATSSTKEVPMEKLTKILTLLMLNISSGAKVCLPVSEDLDDNRLFKELAFERIGRCLDASFIAINIMTSPEMSNGVFIEDVQEAVVTAVKYQLVNLIFPEYDPAYRMVNHAKDNQSSIKAKRAREKEMHKSKNIVYFYNRLVDIISNLSELVVIQTLTDNVVLQLSSLGVSVFFVENISELQLVSLRLITTIFSKYEKHRKLIMDDIIASLSRLPSSKKNMRNYRLNSEDSIQMLTALSLLLVQSVVNVSKIEMSSEPNETFPISPDKTVVKEVVKADNEAIIETSYNNALQTAYSFLRIFLHKSTVKGEDDYRAIFENFVSDLLVTVNKPEWPAAETMLTLLGSLLTNQFVNKQSDQTTRVICIDYLGTVASTLRRDAVSSTINPSDIENLIIDLIKGSKSSDEEDEDEKEEKDKDDEDNDIEIMDLSNDDDENRPTKKNNNNSNNNSHKSQNEKLLKNIDKVQILRDALLDYLNADKFDPTAKYAREFYFGQWYTDCAKELKSQNNPPVNNNNIKDKSKKDISKSNNSNDISIFQKAEDRRNHLLFKMFGTLPDDNKKSKNNRLNKLRGNSDSESNRYDIRLKGSLDYEDACLVCRYLASLKASSQSFDIYLTKICRLLNEQSVAVRTKAMRCLSAVVEADPTILRRDDIEKAVHLRFLDPSTSVREAAVELVGKYLLIRPELIDQYYPMIAERILDKGTSVRKRVIRIFRDICVEHTEFSKIPEICVKMIKRINDEEAIKKLVNEVFQNMWFSPVREKEGVKLLQKVMNITDVVSSCKDIGYEWFDQLLESLLKKEDSDKLRVVEKACKQIVDCLVQNIMRLEEISNDDNQRLVSCMATLHLFTKIRPELMVQYTMTLQSYLNIKNSHPNDIFILHYVARILEVTVPLIEHPAQNHINQLEEDMVKLMIKHGKMVLESCVACLAASVNKISHNYVLVKDCFERYFNCLLKYRLEKDQTKTLPHTMKPAISRGLFTVGLLCKYFDFNSLQLGKDINIRVFETLMFYAEDNTLSCDIRTQAISGIGFLCIRHRELLICPKLLTFYHGILLNTLENTKTEDYPELIGCVLDNIYLFLVEEDDRLRHLDSSWKNNEKKESLKEMGDMSSGTGSHIAQLYLNAILENILQPWGTVRFKAVTLVVIIIRQGLINPIGSVAYLISAQTDPNPSNRVKSDNELAEIDKKFSGFINVKAVQGIKTSCKLQEILEMYNNPDNQSNWCLKNMLNYPVVVRGVYDPNADIPLALNHNLYTMLRSSKQFRRSFLYALLAIFGEIKSRISLLIYVSENLAQFPYQSQEEPLYLVHNIDIMVSSIGPHFTQQIRDQLYPEFAANETSDPSNPVTKPDIIHIDDEENPDVLYKRLIDNPKALRNIRESIRNSRGCVLLISLKQYLRELYSLTDAKIQKYSPLDTGKAWERQLTRRSGVRFDPLASLNLTEETISHENIYQKFVTDVQQTDINLDADLYLNEGYILINKFLHLRQMVIALDSLDIVGDSDDDVIITSGPTNRSKSYSQSKTDNSLQSASLPPGSQHQDSSSINDAAIISRSNSHQIAFIQGQNLRVEVDKLDINAIHQLSSTPRRVQPKKTVVPRQPNISSDEDSDDLLQKDKRSHIFRKKSGLLSKTPLIRPNRKARTKSSKHKSPLDSSSEDSFEENDNIDSDPDFIG